MLEVTFFLIETLRLRRFYASSASLTYEALERQAQLAHHGDGIAVYGEARAHPYLLEVQEQRAFGVL